MNFAKLSKKYKFVRENKISDKTIVYDNINTLLTYDIECSWSYLIHKFGSPILNNYDFCNCNDTFCIKWNIYLKLYTIKNNPICYKLNIVNFYDKEYHIDIYKSVKWNLHCDEYFETIIDYINLVNFINMDYLSWNLEKN